MNEYDLRGRIVAHAFYGELEKIARANPADIASGLAQFTRGAKAADPSARKAVNLTGHSLVDSMRNKWALQKARYGARREANRKLKDMSAEARQALRTGSPEERARAAKRLEGIEEARGHRKGPAKPKGGYLQTGSGSKRGISGPKWLATGVGAGAAGTLIAQNRMAGGSQGGGGGGEYY